MKKKFADLLMLTGLCAAVVFSVCGCGKKEADSGSKIPEIAQGYGTVKWGDSLETVRTAYEIGEDVETKADKDDPAILTLTQENVSDVIASRMFSFVDDKLYRVTVKYPRTVSSADLSKTLSEKYSLNYDSYWDGFGLDRQGNFSADLGITWDHYYPHLLVSLTVYELSRYQHEVRYTWAEFWENYNYAKLTRVEL
ncbi:hypothetical protein FACS189493_2090 [Spirochaetia bacterium]|nr:hypothetical protein FACS189493_2090 [Spirochaetia bacterium]